MGFLGLETLFRGSAEVSYEDGVEEVAGVDEVVFIDPDLFEKALDSVGIDYDNLDVHSDFSDAVINLTQDERTKLFQELDTAFAEYIERKVPGAMDAINEGFKEYYGREPNTGEIAAKIFEAGPAALDNVIVDGEKYGFAILPAEYVDSKDKLVDFFLEDDYDEDVIKSIKENMPGSTGEWLKLVGYHEGQHLDGHDEKDNDVAKLSEEARADRRAIEEMIKDGDGDVALAFKDLRALSNGTDSIHATGPLLDSGDQASTLHLETAQTYKQTMFDAVDKTFDWENYEGDATDAEDLLKEDPDAFFKTVNDGLADLQEEKMQAYNQDPSSYEARGGVVGAQILTDYIQDFEGAYRRRALEQSDFPDNEPTQLIPQDVENEFYTQLARENGLKAVEEAHEMESIGKYNAEDAFEGFDWEKYEGKATSPVDNFADTDLLRENPSLFYGELRNYVTDMKSDAQAQYAANPSHGNLEKMLEAEHIIQAKADAINKGLADSGSKMEPLSKEDFVPDDLRRSYYQIELVIKEFKETLEDARKATEEAERQAESDARKEAERKAREEEEFERDYGGRLKQSSAEPTADDADKGYQQGVDGTAFTTEVSALNDSGKPTVDFKNGVTVGDLKIGVFFAQNVSPEPENVTLVNAMVPESNITPNVPIIPTAENEQSLQTLG